MKRRSRLILPLAAFSLLFSVAATGCGGNNQQQQQSGKEEKITITAAESKTKLILGESVQLTASVEGVTWSSSDETVATVSNAGLVQSLAVGKTTIKAVKSGYKDGQITINVDLPKITVTPATGSIKMDETIQLQADETGVTWTSSDTNVATVSEAGLVTGIYVGTAQISASKDGFNAGKATITVTRPDATGTLHWEDADHYAADGWWGTAAEGATPIYGRSSGNASDQTCIAHFDNGDKETLAFTSSAAVEAELVMTMAASSAISDMSAVMDVKFNNAAVNLANKSFEGGSTSNFSEFSLGTLTLAANNTLEISFKQADVYPYLDDLAIYAKQAATIALTPAPERETITVENAELTVEAGSTVQINVTKPTDLTGVTFTSDKEEVAEVSASGLVTGKSLGSAGIIIKKAGMYSARVTVNVSEHQVAGTILLEAEDAVEVVDGSSNFMKLTDSTSGITRAHSGGAYITGYRVSGEETLTFNFDATAAQAGQYTLAVNGSAAYQATEDFMFATQTTITLNENPVTIAADAAIVAGDGSMSAERVDVPLGDVTVVSGPNTLVVVFHGKAPSLDYFKLVPKA